MAITLDTTESTFDVWRKIPPEEKLQLMARAQSKGLGSSVVLLTITGTMAVGLRLPWLFWAAFGCVPFVFQLASAKAWRDIKPRTVLEYLAARSAARRYAFGTASKDLTLSLMFRGVLSPEFTESEEVEALEARVEHKESIDVWVALFPDTIIMMSERPGGAKLEFAHALTPKVEIEARGFDGDAETRSVALTVDTKKGERLHWVVTSAYPAALLVFERKAKIFLAEQVAQAERDRRAYSELFTTASTTFDDDEMSVSSF